jgi:thiol:disulfide interchange protein DsbC
MKIIAHRAAILAFFLCISVLFAAQSSAAEPDMAATLRKDYPKLNFQQISPGPIEGIFQVVVEQSEIIYYVPAKGYLITGEIWSSDAKNLTREAKAELMTAKAAQFPLDQAIVIGQGPKQVIEVVDPDCPYCREGSAFFAGRTDVTRYIFFFPLNIHPDAVKKAAFVLSSKDRVAAYEDVMGGAYDQQPLPDFQDNGLLAVHQQLGQRLGIRSTPNYWVNGRFVSGSNLKQVEAMLDGKSN